LVSATLDFAYDRVSLGRDNCIRTEKHRTPAVCTLELPVGMTGATTKRGPLATDDLKTSSVGQLTSVHVQDADPTHDIQNDQHIACPTMLYLAQVPPRSSPRHRSSACHIKYHILSHQQSRIPPPGNPCWLSCISAWDGCRTRA
jgi:hypothetical protein